MILWALRVSRDTTEYAVSERHAALLAGVQLQSPERYFFAAREVLSEVVLTPVGSDGHSVSSVDYVDRDFGVWGRCAIFSKRSTTMLLDNGAHATDFVPVRHACGDLFGKFAFVPLHVFDCIDGRSLAGEHQIPLSPPIPFHLTHASVKSDAAEIPPLFLNIAPGHQLPLTEFFVRETIVLQWKEHMFSGAEFRCLG